jgi:FtsP/CotA-like multicopper oxidase with cupredoxin domain
LHANLFHVYRTGTRLEPGDYTDVVMLCQAERHILEFSYNQPGLYMFHAHQSEFNQLGWMGLFDVTDDGAIGTLPATAAGSYLCRTTAQEVDHG